MVPKRAIWVGLYAVAMAFVEAAVVVYLRALDPATGPLSALHTVLPGRFLVIEMYREAATIVMLVAVAALAGRGRREGFLYFALAFATWDIFYYVWLRLLLSWPQSLLAWDVLFLIPVPWVAPVLAPLIISGALVAGSLALLSRPSVSTSVADVLPRFGWLLAGTGAALVLASFTLDSRVALQTGSPPDFRWGLFGIGVGLGVAALLGAVRSGRLLDSAPGSPAE